MSKLRTTIRATITSKQISQFAYYNESPVLWGLEAVGAWGPTMVGTGEITFTSKSEGGGAILATLGVALDMSPTIQSEKVSEVPPFWEQSFESSSSILL